MIYILEAVIKESDKPTVWLRKQIDFAPSQGMIMNCHQLSSIQIGTVHTDGECIVGELEKVMEPTSEECIAYMLKNGWKRKDEFRAYTPATKWIS